MKYWSFSRSRLHQHCPRAYYFKYLLRQSAEARRARVLGCLSTLTMSAGVAVDYVIARSLAAHREGGLKLGLADVGDRLMRRIISESPRITSAMRNQADCTPQYDRHVPPLVNDFYDLDLGREFEERMVTRVRTCLEAFESSELWERLRSSDCSEWAPIIQLDLEHVPFFMLERGLRVSASYDFAVRSDSTVTVLDWKSGTRTQRAELDAADQLSIYGQWAAAHFHLPIEQVEVQAVWLGEGEANWNPQRLEPELVEEVKRRITMEVAEEQSRLIRICVANGEVEHYEVDESAYPPNPSTRRCLECPFRELCPAGQAESAHVASSRTSQTIPQMLLTQASS